MRRLLSWSWPEWAWTLRAAPTLLMVRLALAFLPVGRVESVLHRLPSLGGRCAVDVPLAVRAVNRLSTRLPLVFGRCLHRSIATRWLLARRGMPTDLILGVRSTNDRGLAFHAWLESGGEVVNDSPFVRDLYEVIPYERVQEVLSSPGDQLSR